eukprot:474773-Rhodomonas_salina.1
MAGWYRAGTLWAPTSEKGEGGRRRGGEDDDDEGKKALSVTLRCRLCNVFCRFDSKCHAVTALS